jgi:hypothetical protein
MSTNGMNPFLNSCTHSTWPVVLMILNLHPWLCKKQKYIMMSGLIPGLQQYENDINTYFRSLVEDLKELWYNNGVQVWDEHKREYFGLKASLFVTISDSLATRNLSGQSKKVGCGCPHCFREIDSHYLRESQKIVYMGHRRYIPMKHSFRSMKDKFNGNNEKSHPPHHLTDHEVYEMLKDVHVVLGKQKRTDKNTGEDDLDVHHSIDLMHIEKNVCESLLGTLLNTDEKTRDHGHVRADLKKMRIMPELWLDNSVKEMELPTSCITLSKHEKNEFCGFLKNVKVPSGYSMNVSRLILFLDLKVAPGVKSHDYHVLLTQMIVVGI